MKHVIKSGDTFWGLAQQYNTTINELQRLNPGIDPRRLRIGQEIIIKEEPKIQEYTVQKGDTLSKIGQKFGIDWKLIAEVNKIDNPNLIKVGQVLTIPGAPKEDIIPELDYSNIINFYTKQGWRVTSDYGIRVHPITKQPGTFHRGIDFGGKPAGEPIRTPVAGKVSYSAHYNGWGNLVGITDEQGCIHLFAHLSRRDVNVGNHVKKGQVIGLNGSTGSSTGPHLHYQINVPNGGVSGTHNYCDPKLYKY